MLSTGLPHAAYMHECIHTYIKTYITHICICRPLLTHVPANTHEHELKKNVACGFSELMVQSFLYSAMTEGH